MSGWRSPPVTLSKDTGWFWNKCINTPSNDNKRWAHKYNMFEMQEYVDPLGCIIRTVKNYEPTYYRIISTVRPQKEIAFANSREKIDDMWITLHNEVAPQLVGFSPSQIQSVLPSLIEKLHQKQDIRPMLEDWGVLEESGFVPTDLTGIVEGLKKDNLEISVTFEYTYKFPPPIELCCNTCQQPALDPHVSPLFPGKLFCASCVLFELEGQVRVEHGSQKIAFPAPNLAAMLDKLEVYCPFAKFGCGESLPRGQLDRHLEECAYVCIICINRSLGCNFGAKTKAEAIEHMSSCQYSSAICKEMTESFNATSPPLYPTYPHARLHEYQHSAAAATTTTPITERSIVTYEGGSITAVPTMLKRAPHMLRRCKHCFVDEKEAEYVICKYHIGTWHGYTYEQIQTWRLDVWKHRVSDSLKCIVHYPLQVAKSSSVVGVSVFAVRALLSPPYMLMFGGLLLVLPSWITGPILSTLFSPSKMYNYFYKYPYSLIYGSNEKVDNTNNTNNVTNNGQQHWTCCGKTGLHAAPCASKGYHEYY